MQLQLTIVFTQQMHIINQMGKLDAFIFTDYLSLLIISNSNGFLRQVRQGKTRGRFVCHILRIYIYLIKSPSNS